MKTEATSKRNVVSLIRVSTDKQAAVDKNGMERQRNDITITCERLNLNVTKTFELDGISGTKVQHSAEYKAMLREVAKPSCAGIVISSLDRYFRPENIGTFSDVWKPLYSLRNGNLSIFCDLGELKLNDATDNLKLQLWGAMSGFERAKIQQRTTDGMRIQDCKPDTCTRKLPAGVIHKRFSERVNSGIFGFTDYARTVVAPAFRRVAAGDRLMQVAKDMSEQAKKFGFEIGSVNGFGVFGTKSLRDTLLSRWWLCEKPNGIQCNFDSWKDPVHGTITAEPIITEALWQAVNDRLTANTANDTWTKRNPIKGDFLVAGMMYCGKCGSKMYHKHKKAGGTRGNKDKKHAIYECSNRYRGLGCDMPRVQAHNEQGTDYILAKTLSEKLTQPDFVAVRIQEALAANQTEAKRQELAAAEKLVRELERKQTNLANAIAQAADGSVVGILTKTMDATASELAEARSNARTLAQTMQANIDPLKAAERVKKIFSGFDSMKKSDQIAILHRYVQKIIYNVSPYAEISKAGSCDYGSLDVRLKVSESEGFEVVDGQPNSEGEVCFSLFVGLTSMLASKQVKLAS